MGEQATAAIAALIAALKDKDTNVRSSAAFALGRMGEQAKVAIPALIAALKTPDLDSPERLGMDTWNVHFISLRSFLDTSTVATEN